ncbi:MAG: ATP-grasp domain-containing protein [Thermodesulfobacteriota bacterium]
MEFLYLSPEFPPNYANFIIQLDRIGVNVWAIGEADFFSMPPELQSAIKWYIRAHLGSPEMIDQVIDELIRSKQAMGKPPHFDIVESHNEQWLSLEAFINRKLDMDGIRPHQLPRLKKKSVMKEQFRECGLRTARGELVRNPQQALELADALGYPVILKPDEGVGAGGIHRVEDESALRRILPELHGDYFLEEFIAARIVSYDGLTDYDGGIIFENTLIYGDGVLEYIHGKDTFFYTARIIPPGLSDIGERLVRHFDIRRKFFHFEFFDLDGQYLPIEINCRPPGGAILDMMNYSVDDDLYAGYARMIAGGKAQMAEEKKYYCAYVGRRDRAYALSHDDILARCGACLTEFGENPPIYRQAMSDRRYILRSPSESDLLSMAADIQRPL